MARYATADNFVDNNKREASTIFVNHLIDLGVVTLNGRRVTTGPNFQEYVRSLDMGSRGYYNVHNTRCVVEGKLGRRNFYCSETGGPGRYRCSLQFPNYRTGKRNFNNLKKIVFHNCFSFSRKDLRRRVRSKKTRCSQLCVL